MASQVGICNLALSHLGTKATIAAMDEASDEARVCSTHFDDVRDTLLREFDWNFARRVETLALRSETAPTGYDYCYSVPNKCLRFRGIWLGPRPIQLAPPRWEIGSITDASNNDVVALFTSQDLAEGIYTRQIENTELFSRGFVLALQWRLAEASALPITNRESIQERTIKLGALKVAQGMAMEANEGITNVDDVVPSFISARGAGAADVG